jgi:hypothetical protein
MKKPLIIPDEVLEKMRSYLEGLGHVKASASHVAKLLHKAFPAYTVQFLRKSDFVKDHVNTLLSADALHIAEKLEEAKEEIEAETGIRTDFRSDAGTIEGKRVKSLDDLIEACGIDLEVWEIERYVSNKWEVGAKNAQKEIQVTPLYQIKAWLRRRNPNTFDYHKLREGLIEDMKAHAPVYRTIKHRPVSEPHLLVVDSADPHFGKLATLMEGGGEYNLKVVEERVLEGVEGIVNKARGYPIDRILYITGNDMLHTDNKRRTTTAGTPQDTDGMWYDAAMVAKRTNVKALEGLGLIAPVDVVFNVSNHDEVMGWMLFDAISTWFRNTKHFTFDGSPAHRKYYRYGKNLIGTTHGNGVKPQDLMHYMAHEAPKLWADTTFRYWYYHHVHHMDRIKYRGGKDFVGGTVESLRSPSEADSWHHQKGFCGGTKAIEGFLHSKEHGQVARLTHIFS